MSFTLLDVLRHISGLSQGHSVQKKHKQNVEAIAISTNPRTKAMQCDIQGNATDASMQSLASALQKVKRCDQQPTMVPLKWWIGNMCDTKRTVTQIFCFFRMLLWTNCGQYRISGFDGYFATLAQYVSSAKSSPGGLSGARCVLPQASLGK